MFCTTLDLESATCLTGISLKGIDSQCMPCELMLPSSVEQLKFFGISLTTVHAQKLPEGLPNLTQVMLGTNNYRVTSESVDGYGSGRCQNEEFNSLACMPTGGTMPSSLR